MNVPSNPLNVQPTVKFLICKNGPAINVNYIKICTQSKHVVEILNANTQSQTFGFDWEIYDQIFTGLEQLGSFSRYTHRIFIIEKTSLFTKLEPRLVYLLEFNENSYFYFLSCSDLIQELDEISSKVSEIFNDYAESHFKNYDYSMSSARQKSIENSLSPLREELRVKLKDDYLINRL